MSDIHTDSFIQEVTEEVRQDQMFKLWKKWAPLIIGGVVVVVGAAGGWSWMRHQQQVEAEARGEMFLAADPEDAEAMAALAGKLDGPGQLIAEMAAASALAANGESAEAARRYAAIAGRDGVAPEYGDLAKLMAVRLGAEGADAAAMLDSVADGTGPYALLARELRAVRRLAAGDAAAAHAELNAILRDTMATNAMRQRAVALLTASGGTIEPAASGS